MKRAIGIVLLLNTMMLSVQCQHTVFPDSNHSAMLSNIRDSLDNVVFDIPEKIQVKTDLVHDIKTQEEWDNLTNLIKKWLEDGERNITIRVKTADLVFGDKVVRIENLNYPDANIQIEGNHVKMLPWGKSFDRDNPTSKTINGFYALPYKNFHLNEIVLDDNENELPLYGKTFTTSQTIEEVKEESGIWRFPVNLPDISHADCRDFCILLTRDWTACRHQVVRVNNGYLYFELKSKDSPTPSQDKLDPNKDKIHYNIRPRYRFVNCPLSNDIHFFRDSVFIPIKYKSVYIGKGARLFLFNNCNFCSLTISGFNVVGASKQSVIALNNSVFSDGAWIHNNTFSNLSECAVTVYNCENVRIDSNSIYNTRVGAIACYGTNNVVMNNKLQRIGWMLNTRAITGGGEKLHICNNVIEDFNYGAIACGSTISNDNAPKLTYIIERNEIRYTMKYAKEFMSNTLADAGGIYIGPQCTWGIIRNNVVLNMTGPHYNRGIYLDDGAKNLAIYGNLVMNTANFYDIDLRRCDMYSSGIPDHNTNNMIFHNVMTGSYKFQDSGLVNDHCFGGQNILLGLGGFQKNIVDLKESVPDVIIEGCSYKNDKVTIPKQYEPLLDSIHVDGFVRNHILVRSFR